MEQNQLTLLVSETNYVLKIINLRYYKDYHKHTYSAKLLDILSCLNNVPCKVKASTFALNQTLREERGIFSEKLNIIINNLD
jgi:hypothetical protein